MAVLEGAIKVVLVRKPLGLNTSVVQSRRLGCGVRQAPLGPVRQLGRSAGQLAGSHWQYAHAHAAGLVLLLRYGRYCCIGPIQSLGSGVAVELKLYNTNVHGNLRFALGCPNFNALAAMFGQLQRTSSRSLRHNGNGKA